MLFNFSIADTAVFGGSSAYAMKRCFSGIAIRHDVILSNMPSLHSTSTHALHTHFPTTYSIQNLPSTEIP